MLIAFLAGCASVPKPVMFKQVTLRGKTYVPLISLCQQYEIDWEWDSFGRIVYLNKLSRQIKMLIGSTTIIVDGHTEKITRSPEIYDGVVVVPAEFEQELKRLLSDE